MQTEIILYGTQGCHLCDEAEQRVLPIAAALGIKVCLIDISGTDELEDRYALRIPVLCCGKLELDWPFTPAEIKNIIQNGKHKPQM